MKFERLGPYRIVRRIGRGGMGTVYEGVDDQSGQTAAIKVLSVHLADDEGFRERFEAEIESLKKLRHPNIVRLYGYGEQDGHLFYSMELVDGITLEEALRSGTSFSWREVLQIGIDVSKALKHAHDHGVIHRDIKPANLLQASDGTIKLSDFGVARIFGGNQLTQAGGVLGTAEYMSPEQASASSVDHRCDQYSLGGVLYALLARRPPFRASGVPELISLQRFAQPEPVRRFAPETPAELERIVTQLLEKDRGRRFRNAQVLARRLEATARALSRARHEDPQQQEASGEGADDHRSISVAETRLATEESCSREAGPSEAPGSIVQRHVPESGAPALADSEPFAPPEPARFTAVDSPSRSPDSRRRAPSPTFGLQGLMLLASLCALSVAAWYVSRPHSADGLFADIESALAEGTDDAVLRVADRIDEFQQRFPKDPRGAALQQAQQRIALLRLDRRLTGLARRPFAREPLSPPEQLFVDAMAVAESRPEQAVGQLQALVQLLEHRPNADPTPFRSLRDASPALCVRLARQKIASLQEEIRTRSQPHRALLRQRLADAAELRASDVARARQIWQAVIELYADKPWAEDEVARARAGLEQTRPVARQAAASKPTRTSE